MPASLRVRGTCQECHTHGYFTPLEQLLWIRGAWEWSKLTLCAICRLHLLELHQMALLPGSTSSRSRRR